MWAETEKAIHALELNYAKARIYQDGLPACGKEIEIVQDLAKLGSPNHQLLLKLMERGARLMGTESAELLVQEYQVIRQAMENNDLPAFSPQRGQSEDLLESILIKRDEFIAQRINATLRPGDIGMVFLGMLHSLSPWLAPDIEVVYPLNIPPKQGTQDHG